MVALWYKAVLWIRIRSDPKLLAGSGYGSWKIIVDPGRSGFEMNWSKTALKSEKIWLFLNKNSQFKNINFFLSIKNFTQQLISCHNMQSYRLKEGKAKVKFTLRIFESSIRIRKKLPDPQHCFKVYRHKLTVAWSSGSWVVSRPCLESRPVSLTKRTPSTRTRRPGWSAWRVHPPPSGWSSSTSWRERCAPTWQPPPTDSAIASSTPTSRRVGWGRAYLSTVICDMYIWTLALFTVRSPNNVVPGIK